MLIGFFTPLILNEKESPIFTSLLKMLLKVKICELESKTHGILDYVIKGAPELALSHTGEPVFTKNEYSLKMVFYASGFHQGN